MANQCLVIVESPAKARTIEKFLPGNYTVLASMGHVRDLPKSQLGVDVDANFEPTYEVSPDKKKIIATLKAAAKKSDTLYLATDEDREGEAIAWHLAEAIGLDVKKVQRVVFHEVTKEAILAAVKSPRPLDIARVDAQQARRVLDRLVGYKLSPFLWRKVVRGLSAGRVQSVAVRLVVERERQREAFKTEEYWSIEADFLPEGQGKTSFRAKLQQLGADKVMLNDEKATKQVLTLLERAAYHIGTVTKKERNRQPYAPFTTSTLQQDAARKLGFSAKKTMFVAQQLYEGVEIDSGERTGLITYMRTDSLFLANSAVEAIRALIRQTYGAAYLPSTPRVFKNKSKGAQEAHEAIRPTQITRLPEQLEQALSKDQLRLYTLIYQRTLASQMEAAVLDQTTVDVVGLNPSESKRSILFRATGSVIKFPGFLAVYDEGKDDENGETSGKEDKEIRLPALTEGDKTTLTQLLPEQHFTQPPPRYTEATLVKTLEEHGIGRPSTYAPIISTIQDRGYVELDQKRFAPTEIGKVVTDLLVEHFANIVDVEFTARMESELDHVAVSKQDWRTLLSDFYFPFVKLIDEKQDSVERSNVTSLQTLGTDKKSGKPITVRVGRYGPYVQIGDKEDEEKPRFSAIPKGVNPETLTLEQAMKLFDLPRVVGLTASGEEIKANVGRFGPYVQVGKVYYSLKEDDPYSISLDRAREVVAVGEKAKAEKQIKIFTGSAIQILNGRYGPYITDGKKNAKIPKGTEPSELTLVQCEEMIAAAPERKKGGWRGRKKK